MRAGRRVIAAVGVAALTAGLLSAPGPAAVAQDELPGAGYTPLSTPTRVLDTRTDVGGHRGPLQANEIVNLAIPGVPTGATAVVLNVTGTGATSSTYLSVFPDQFAGTSTLNLDTGQTAAVAAFVGLGAKNTVNVLNRSGSVEVVADLVGYFAPGGGDTFASSPAPTRILDTRTAVGGHQRPLGAGEELTLRVHGAGGVPAAATAAVVNVTAVAPTADTYLRVTPDGRPGTSTLNAARGTTRANLAVVGIGADGGVRIRNAYGSTNVVVDVQGWFAPGAGGRYVPLPVPRRVTDTRTDGGGALAAGATRSWSFAGTGVPAGGRTAVLFSLTAVRPATDTYLTAWPQGRARPLASNVNLRAGEIASNPAISDTAAVSVFNLSGSTHAVIDAAGYFYTPGDAPAAPAAPAVTRVAAAGDRTRVEWSAPGEGGLPVTGYTVTARPGGLTATVDGHRDAVDLAGLNPGVSYRITVAATNFAGTGPESAPSGPVSPTALSRVDTDRAGSPDHADGAWVRDLSGDGRYAALTAASNSVLVPPPYRTTTDTGLYALRKDLQTGEVVLAGVTRDGGALPVAGSTAIDRDGSVVAYAGAPTRGQSTLYVRDLVRQTVTEVATVPSGRAARDVALTADGSRVTWTVRASASTGAAIHAHDLRTGETSAVLDCPGPATGCALFDVGGTSDDGGTVLFRYRPGPADDLRLAVLDTASGAVRALPEGGDGDGFALSGDGRWAFYARAVGGRYELRTVATTAGAAPRTVLAWTDGRTEGVYLTDVAEDGSVIAYSRRSTEPGQWYMATPGYVHDQARGVELRTPQARTGAYTRTPVLDAAGRLALVTEDCFLNRPCSPRGEYLVSLPELSG